MSAKEVPNIDPSLDQHKKLATFSRLEEFERALRSAEKTLEIDSSDAYEWYENGATLNNLSISMKRQ